jgi:hypothetical protein
VSGQEFLGGQTPTAFALHNQYPQRIPATANYDAGFVGLQDFARRPRAFDGFGLPDL